MPRLARLLLGAGLTVMLAGSARSAATAGQIVIEDAGDLRAHLVQTGTSLVLPVGKRHVHLVVADAPVADVVHITRKPGEIILELRPRAVVHTSVVGKALVVDVSDPVAVQAAEAPATASPARASVLAANALIPGLPDSLEASVIGLRSGAKAPAKTIAPGRQADRPPSAAQASAPNVAPSAQIKESSASQTTGPSNVQAVTASAAEGCLMLPAGRAAGVAMYRRGAETVVVVDRSLPPSSTSDGSWWQAHKPQWSQAAEWTALRVATARGEGIRIERQIDGLCLTMMPSVPPADPPIAYQSRSTDVSFGIARPGKSLTVIDPVTGALLLVGTDAGGAGGLRPTRRSALFTIDQSLAGVVVEPLSDRLGLHRTSDGFDLTIDGAASIHVPPGFADTAIASVDGLTRTLSITDEPIDALTRRMRQRALAAALAPLRARSDRRLDLAEAMVALGLGSEARSVLITAAADDPVAAASPRAALLGAIASILDPRRESSDPFAASSFPETEEGKLWRALACKPPAPPAPAAVVIRRGMPLLLSYPTRLRDAAAAQAARVLLAGDDPDALRAIDLLPDSEAVRLARARAAARLGHPAEALASLDRLARSRDLGIMAGALREAIRLRLAAGELTPAASADLLDAHRLDWRLSGQEAPALLEEAEDRMRVPDLRAAFGLWHDAVEADPSVRTQVDARRLAALNRLADPTVAARVTASDFASIIAQNADAIPEGSDLAARTGLILAEKFAALGLDDHEAETLGRLVKSMPPGVARATIDTQLAALDVTQGSTAAATDTLAHDDDAGLPPLLLARRTLVRARALEAQGKPDDALSLLAAASDDGGLQLKAKLLMARQDWHAALVPLTALFHRLPAQGPLDTAQGALALQLIATTVRDGGAALSPAKEIAPRLQDESERRSLAVLMAPLSPTVSPDTPVAESRS